MQVAQRGTSASSQTTSDYFTCDRWKTEASGATYNTSQQAMSATDLLTTGFSHFFRMEVTTGNNNSGISQKIEAKNIRQYRGENLTVSFYAKGTNPNGGSFSLNRFFTGQTAGNTSFTVTSSWVRYTITFVYPDEGSLDTTLNTSLMALSFLQPAGDTSTNAWTLDITGIQLELGSSATPFEHRSYGEELLRCQRYFYDVTQRTSGGLAVSSMSVNSWYNIGVDFPVTMRTAPSFTHNLSNAKTIAGAPGADQISWYFQNQGWHGASSSGNINTSSATNHSCGAIIGNYYGTANNNNAGVFRWGTGIYLRFDAEL